MDATIFAHGIVHATDTISGFMQIAFITSAVIIGMFILGSLAVWAGKHCDD